MGRTILSLIAAIIWAYPATAENAPVKHYGTGKRCHPIHHKPDDSVAYKPGTDKDGWLVASPDLHEPLKIDPAQVTMPLDLPAKAYVKDPTKYNVPMDELRLRLGEITFDAEGQPSLNGQKLNPEDPEWQSVCE